MSPVEYVFTGCANYVDNDGHDCQWFHGEDIASWCWYCLHHEVLELRDVLVSAEGYAISHGAELPFVSMFVEDSPKSAVIERAGTYARDARPWHPGPLALNRPPGREGTP